MAKQLFLFALFIIFCSSSFSQQSSDSVKIPDPFHLQVKVFKGGMKMFGLNSRKKVAQMHHPEIKKDTTIHFEWNSNAKRLFFAVLNRENMLEDMKALSIPKPENLENHEALLYMRVVMNEQNVEMWIKPSKLKDDKRSEKVREFMHLMMNLFRKSSVRNIRELRR